MTIDPMAAVTTTASGAGTTATGVDPASPAAPAVSPQNATQAAAVDLFDYALQHRSNPPAIDMLAPESRANYLASPSALGEAVLQKMESFHRRAGAFAGHAGGPPSSQAIASSGADGVMNGPAAQHVAGSAGMDQDQIFSGLRRVMDYAVETTMMTTSSSQFGKTVNTLLRGQ